MDTASIPYKYTACGAFHWVSHPSPRGGANGSRPSGRIDLLAHARTWGWLFDPLAVYYCHDHGSRALCVVVLEVTNTPWGERHHYVLDMRDGVDRAVTVAKGLHVSPFLPMDVVYEIRARPPGQRNTLAITVRRGNGIVFSAAMSLRRRPFNRRTLLALLIRHPLLTHRVSVGIHARALRLWRRREPYFRHRAFDIAAAD